MVTSQAIDVLSFGSVLCLGAQIQKKEQQWLETRAQSAGAQTFEIEAVVNGFGSMASLLGGIGMQRKDDLVEILSVWANQAQILRRFSVPNFRVAHEPTPGREEKYEKLGQLKFVYCGVYTVRRSSLSRKLLYRCRNLVNMR